MRPRALIAAVIAFRLVSLSAPACAQGVKHGQIQVQRPKIGLALGGGGMRAAAHVGILKALEEEGIPVDIIVGTDMGAVVGGLYSAGVTCEHMQADFTRRKLVHAYLSVPLALRILVIPLFYTPRLIGIKPYDGLYRGKRFADYLNKRLPETERDIEDLKIPFGAVAVNLLDGQKRIFASGNLGRALQASCAIPALRKPVKIEDGLYVDGGALANLPVSETKKLGADIVIACDIDERIEPTDEAAYRKIGSVSHRVVAMHFNKVDEDEREMADYIIHPDVTGIGLISTSAKDARSALAAGEKAGHSAAPAIRELIERYQKKN